MPYPSLATSVFAFSLLAAQDSPDKPKPPVAVEKPAVEDKRTELNLLGKTDAESGESRRNENVQFNLIDNNALKELNSRIGTSATIVTEFQPERRYFGTEFGNKPVSLIHLDPAKSAPDFHGGVSFSHSNSILSARSFFQVAAYSRLTRTTTDSR